MDNRLSIINERGTLTRYIIASGFAEIMQQPVFNVTELQCQMLMCYFSEVLNIGIRSASPVARVGNVFIVDVTPSRRADPPLPFCPSANLDRFYAAVSAYLSRWDGSGFTESTIDQWLTQIEWAARDVVRSAQGLTRDELGFLLLQLYRWKNVIRGGSF